MELLHSGAGGSVEGALRGCLRRQLPQHPGGRLQGTACLPLLPRGAREACGSQGPTLRCLWASPKSMAGSSLSLCIVEMSLQCLHVMHTNMGDFMADGFLSEAQAEMAHMQV